MRRPLKPFVTEYKGGRRPQGQPQGFGPSDPQTANPPGPASSGNGQPSAGHQRPGAQSASSPASPRGPRDSSGFDHDWARPKTSNAAARPDPEDAYEAALRAADALFTRPETPRAAQESAPRPPEASTEQPGSPTPPDRGGRILQAIDEPPSPQFAALEAAYAPKRRGRKPGSKNKPKVPAASELPAADPKEASSAPLARRDARLEPAPAAAPPPAPSPAAPAVQRIEAVGVPNDMPRGERRAPWQRDRLKPGEGWKRRRLPRVCW